ncbi:MAG: CinA family protein [Coxiellaceae bacterium]|nr:CinA family protein [Coxiellaceae bacterium]
MNNDILTLSQQLGDLLKQKKHTLALAESCTGGGIAQAITAIAGSSAWFDRGFVTYSNQAKMDMLSVTSETLASDGAVSEATAKQMAQGAVDHSLANVALSVTGVAGPDGGSDEKPVGTVWFGMTCNNHVTAEQQLFSGDRAAVRQAAVQHALQLLIGCVSAC